MLTIIGEATTSNKSIISQQLIKKIEDSFNDISGTVYIGFPIYVNSLLDEKLVVDIAFVTNFGFLAVNILEETMINYTEIQDDLYIKLDTKFKKTKELLDKRKLLFEINILTFSTVKQEVEDESNIAFSADDFYDKVKDIFTENFNFDLLEKINAGIQESIGIIDRTYRNDAIEGTKGFLINKMNEKIETYDSSQMDAIITEPIGIQRIRGMAGSGKTIVLARKAVELHMSHPEWKIVVTYFTRSLKKQLTKLIDRFYSIRNDGDKKPNYDNLKILHSWGSSTSPGLYYEICNHHSLSFRNFAQAKMITYPGDRPFDSVCTEILGSNVEFEKMYDCILVDEAQDLSPDFFKLCMKVLDNNERLVYAYDELQNLKALSLPNPQEIFGKNVGIDTPLKTCYRNQSSVIVTAHALGMGIYREEGLIQLPGSPDVWGSIGYICDKDILQGEQVVLYRNKQTSPDLLNAPKDDLISFHKYNEESEMYSELINMISKNLSEDYLDLQDVMIIDMDAISSADNYNKLLSMIYSRENNSIKNVHLAGSNNPEDFFRENSIVYSSVFRAKGNESFMVYILNAQKCVNSLTTTKDRNSLFTAITRSKGWVNVLGIGDKMESLKKEFEMIKENDFKLVFKYPTEEEQKSIILNNKDITNKQEEEIKKAKTIFNDLYKNGKIPLQDLISEFIGEEALKELKNNDEQ